MRRMGSQLNTSEALFPKFSLIFGTKKERSLCWTCAMWCSSYTWPRTSKWTNSWVVCQIQPQDLKSQAEDLITSLHKSVHGQDFDPEQVTLLHVLEKVIACTVCDEKSQCQSIEAYRIIRTRLATRDLVEKFEYAESLSCKCDTPAETHVGYCNDPRTTCIIRSGGELLILACPLLQWLVSLLLSRSSLNFLFTINRQLTQIIWLIVHTG